MSRGYRYEEAYEDRDRDEEEHDRDHPQQQQSQSQQQSQYASRSERTSERPSSAQQQRPASSGSSSSTSSSQPSRERRTNSLTGSISGGASASTASSSRRSVNPQLSPPSSALSAPPSRHSRALSQDSNGNGLSGSGQSSPNPPDAGQSLNFKVVVRIRPPLPRELDGMRMTNAAGGGGGGGVYRDIVRTEERNRAVTICESGVPSKDGSSNSTTQADGSTMTTGNSSGGVYATHKFTFDYVYDQDAQQVDVYRNTAREAVMSTLQGYNATLLAYGQTGTGSVPCAGCGGRRRRSARKDAEGTPHTIRLRALILPCYNHLYHVAMRTDVRRWQQNIHDGALGRETGGGGGRHTAAGVHAPRTLHLPLACTRVSRYSLDQSHSRPCM
jgi:hypothetical protein